MLVTCSYVPASWQPSQSLRQATWRGLKYSMAKGNNWIMSQKPIQPRREANNRNHSTTPSEACHEKFRHWAHAFAIAAGSPWCFVAAVLLILGWGATGPIFHFSDTWQLVIN